MHSSKKRDFSILIQVRNISLNGHQKWLFSIFQAIFIFKGPVHLEKKLP
jgi:hypothetical protein